MPIVSITLKNFRSYAVEVVEQFNRRLNVVLGKNGEGKSNLLRGTPALIQLCCSCYPTRCSLIRQKGTTSST